MGFVGVCLVSKIGSWFVKFDLCCLEKFEGGGFLFD